MIKTNEAVREELWSEMEKDSIRADKAEIRVEKAEYNAKEFELVLEQEKMKVLRLMTGIMELKLSLETSHPFLTS